jgi:probable methyltransferase
MNTIVPSVNINFLNDVLEGMSLPLKKISSKYFYDAIGDKIFQEIMHLDEYYLPNAELEIIKTQTAKILKRFSPHYFDVVELGAGDGTKTVYLLEQLIHLGRKITYRPLDISEDVLKTNAEVVATYLPALDVKPLVGDYIDTLSSLAYGTPKLILFLGSNIGNFSKQDSIDFLKKIRDVMQPGDALILGMDLKKNPNTILAAYNDSKGVTKRFNLNLLARINRELGGNFDLSSFDHYPSYDPITGTTYSFIVSLKDQEVRIMDQTFKFETGEVIHTEFSQKYNLDQIKIIGNAAGFKTIDHYLDDHRLFSINVLSE